MSQKFSEWRKIRIIFCFVRNNNQLIYALKVTFYLPFWSWFSSNCLSHNIGSLDTNRFQKWRISTKEVMLSLCLFSMRTKGSARWRMFSWRQFLLQWSRPAQSGRTTTNANQTFSLCFSPSIKFSFWLFKKQGCLSGPSYLKYVSETEI